MFLRLDLLVLGVYERLGVHELHLYGLQVLFENLKALLVLLDLQAQLGHESHLLADNLVELLVLVVGVGREVLVQLVLRDRVNDFVCHLECLCLSVNCFL